MNKNGEGGANVKRRLGMAVVLCCLAASVLLLHGCQAGGDGEIEYVIGVSLANMREPWRLVLMDEIQQEAAKHPEVRLVFADATQDAEKQIDDIHRLQNYGIDLLVVSPCDVVQITPVVGEVYRSIPVIVLDRAVEGFDYSLFIGPDNEIIGKKAGTAVLELMGDDAGTVLELFGNPQSQASNDRSEGFRSVLAEAPSLEIQQLVVDDDSRDKAEDLVMAYEDLAEIDCIFAHNDYIALGAYRALDRRGLDIPIIGIDGFASEDGGLDMIRQGKLYKTVTCPTGGKEAIQCAMDILNEVQGVPKQIILRSHTISLENVDAYEEKLNQEPVPLERTIRVGYAQVGAESTWRLTNTKSIKEAAKDFGIELLYDEADQSQERQIAAIRRFIQEDVDVIVLSPVIDTGWDEVLYECKEAGIPVLLSDRRIQVEDDSLYMTYFGADAVEEGRRAMRWLLQNSEDLEKPVRILEIEGTIGASPTIDRHEGFREILEQNPGYEVVYRAGGEYTYEDGCMVVEEYLEDHPWDIDVIFSHNDNMAIGAIDTLQEYGYRPGEDTKIISVDGTRIAFEAMLEGTLNCTVECSPLLGPQLMKAIQELMAGEELPIQIITDEKVYTQENAAEALPDRLY